MGHPEDVVVVVVVAQHSHPRLEMLAGTELVAVVFVARVTVVQETVEEFAAVVAVVLAVVEAAPPALEAVVGSSHVAVAAVAAAGWRW